MMRRCLQSYSLQEDGMCSHTHPNTRNIFKLQLQSGRRERVRGQRETKHDNLANKSVYPFFWCQPHQIYCHCTSLYHFFSPFPSTLPLHLLSPRYQLSRPMEPPQGHPGEGLRMEPLNLLLKLHRTCVQWSLYREIKQPNSNYTVLYILCIKQSAFSSGQKVASHQGQ